MPLILGGPTYHACSFLYAIEGSSNHPTFARFVEVKKPEEPASRVQLEEIDFLNKLGLHARVLRLVER